MDKYFINTVLQEPTKPIFVPIEAKWLAGEGAGSWFYFMQKDNLYQITRYSEEGIIECEGLFELLNTLTFNISEEFYITYLSHCQQVKIIQNNSTIIFNRLNV